MRRSLVWMLLSQGSNVVFQFGSTVVVARLLTPYDTGIFAAALAVIGILGVFQSIGVAVFVIREPEIDPDMLATAFTLNAAVSLGLATAIAGSSVLGGALLGEPGVHKVMLLLAPIPLLSIPQFLPATLIERAGDFRRIALVNVTRVVVGSTSTVILALAGIGYLSLAWGTLAGAAASAAAFMIVGRHHLRFRLGLRGWRRIAAFSGHQFAIGGITEISVRLTDFALGSIAGLAALGLYGRAVGLNNAIWSNVHLAVGRVVLVDFAAKRARGESLREPYLHALDLTTAMLWPAFVGLAATAGPIIRLLYGDRWNAAAPALAALSLAAALLVSITLTWELFAVSHETHRQAKLEIVRATIGSALFIGASFLGLTQAAVSRLGDAAFSILLYRPHIERFTETGFADFAAIYRKNAVLTLIACGPSIAVMAAWHWSPDTPVHYLAAGIALGGLGWLARLRLIAHPLGIELAAAASAVWLRLRGRHTPSD